MPKYVKNDNGVVVPDYSEDAISAVLRGEMSFCRFLTANDTGLTGGHQAGIYIAKTGVEILFDEPGVKGENKDKWAQITWQDGTQTESRFIYYGQGTRNEYRITNFGRGFPFLHVDYTGALFALVRNNANEYQAFVLNTDDEMEAFMDAFGMTPADTNRMIDTTPLSESELEEDEFSRFIHTLGDRFPTTAQMSHKAREIESFLYDHEERIQLNPDKKLLDWTNMEYRLFKAVEFAFCGDLVKKGFETVDEFVEFANQVLNRRKSRAGKGLENHLGALFEGNEIRYESQAVTEGNKKPDFLFPSKKDYHDQSFPTEKLITLAAKTTCKDRWRQVLNEANRLRDRNKYLCTLQQGISEAQMDEMEQEKVILVVPKDYIHFYPKSRRDRIWSIADFVQHAKELQA